MTHEEDNRYGSLMASARLISRAFSLASNRNPSLPLTFCKRLSIFVHALPPRPSESLLPASASNPSISPACFCFPSRGLTIHGQCRLFTSTTTENEADGDNNDETKATGTEEIQKSVKLPAPYDALDKIPVIEEPPKDPKDLQAIFRSMRTEDGLLNHAVKMFDALSKDGLTHEASELSAQIKDKGHIPSVVAHTAVIEAYANADQPKEALRVYLRMLASGVSPNAYTYTVLIKGLSADVKYIGDAKKYLMEMVGKGMKPNTDTYIAVFEALAKERKLDEAWELLEQMKDEGFLPDEKTVRKVLSNKQGQSTWRGSFIDGFLFKTKKNRDLLVNKKIWSRRSTIWPEFANSTVRIYNGKAFVRCKLTEGKVGHKFGEFALTRKRRPRTNTGGQAKKKGKK